MSAHGSAVFVDECEDCDSDGPAGDVDIDANGDDDDADGAGNGDDNSSGDHEKGGGDCAVESGDTCGIGAHW